MPTPVVEDRLEQQLTVPPSTIWVGYLELADLQPLRPDLEELFLSVEDRDGGVSPVGRSDYAGIATFFAALGKPFVKAWLIVRAHGVEDGIVLQLRGAHPFN